MSAWHRSTLAVALLGIALGAHEGAQSASQLSSSDHEKCVIEGVVTSVPTGEPLKGTQVYLTAVGKYKALFSTETDGTGTFSIKDIEPGEYTLRTDKTGYYDLSRNCDSEDVQSDDDIKLAPGQHLDKLKLQLMASAVITGTVFDPKGEPLPDADVEAVSFEAFRGVRLLGNAVSPKTSDDRGQFRIYHLKPGKYFVRVSDAVYFGSESDDEKDNEAATRVKGFLPIYYPNTTELNQATLLDVKPGEELSQINLTVRLAEVLRIRGSVVNGLTGEPIANGSVSVTPLPPAIRENGSSSMSIGEDSRFEIKDLVPGKYIVSADGWELLERRHWGGARQIELTDSTLDDVQIRVFPSHDLTGRIELAGGKKMGSSRVQVQLDLRNDSNYGFAFANVKADGTFFITDLKQDMYDISVSGLPDGYYLKSASLGTLDVTDGLRVSGEGITMPLVLQASSSGAQVEGVVMTAADKRACSSTVVLVPDGSRRFRRFLYQEAGVDRAGHYVISGITPGDYKLFPFDHPEDVGYLDPAALSIYENKGQPVHLEAGDRRTVMLKVIVTGTNNP
jgi:hypothetical protein